MSMGTPSSPQAIQIPKAWFLRLWRQLTALPNYDRVADMLLFHKATLLQLMLIGTLGVITATLLIGISTDVLMISKTWKMVIIGLSYFVGYSIGLGFNRAGFYRLASAIFMAGTWIGPQIISYAIRDQLPAYLNIHWASLTSIVIASALYPSLRAILGMGLLNIVSTVVLYQLTGNTDSINLVSPVATISTLTICTFIIRVHRSTLEQERRIELMVANRQLQKQIGERDQLAQGLTAIMKASDELMAADSLDNLWKRGVELARSHLKVERCAIFNYDAAKRRMTGTYGTTQSGETVSEHDNCFDVNETTWLLPALGDIGDKSWIVDQDRKLWEYADGENRLITKGWNACTVITDQKGLPTAIMLNDCAISGQPFDPNQQDLIGLYCSMLGGIIERKRAETERDQQQVALATANAQLQHQMTDRERLTKGLTSILAAADDLIKVRDLDTLWKRGVELANETLCAVRCAIYEYDPATGEMTGTYGMQMAGNIVSEHGNRININNAWFDFTRQDRKGKSWAVAHDVALSEYTDHTNKIVARGWVAYTPISSRYGLPSAAMFNDSGTSGNPFDPVEQDLLGIYCSLLGGIAERKRAEAQRDAQELAVWESSNKLTQQIKEREQLTQGLTTILGATNELMIVTNLDQLWRRGVELARERLNLERCSIFEIDAESGEMIGTYGTNSAGDTTFEHDKRLKITETHWGELIDASREQKPWIVKHNIDLHEFSNGVNRTIAWGWLACTRITDKNGLPSAVLFHDCALSGRVFDPVEQDLIGLYCSLLGSIIERKRREMQVAEQQVALVVANDNLKHQMEDRERITTGLTTILTTAEDLLLARDLDTLWRRGVELAHKHLTPERCGIFEYNAATGELVGTYGVDMAGKTIWEYEHRFKVADSIWKSAAIFEKRDKSWMVLQDVDLREFVDGEFRHLGNGWAAITAVAYRDGLPTVVFLNDSAISGKPFDPLRQELVGVYCSLLGGIIERKRAEIQVETQQATLQTTNALLKQQVGRNERLTNGLTKILNASDELLATASLDQLWKRSSELAREILGLDRNSIYQYDAATNEMSGTYGSDMSGATVAEHDKRFSIERDPWLTGAMEKKGGKIWAVQDDQDLHEYRDGVDVVVAHGWIAYTLISNRAGLPAAVMFNDNSISGQAFDPLNQDLVGVYCTLLGGIIERKRAEEQLEENVKELRVAKRMADESSRIKSEFLANVSHELRTPLNAIIGFSDMLMMGMSGELNSKQIHKMTRLRENGVRLLTLINNVLDLTRLEARRVEIVNKPFSPHDLVKRIASQTEVLAQQKNLQFSTQIDVKMPNLLNGDEQRIEQVVVNLLSNAFKFTEHGSVILSICSDQASNAWQMTVTDTGIGIPPHALNMIFEEFRQVDGSFSRTYKGSGLGLAITRNLIRLMNGHIDVSSEIGKGSVFTVSLPIVGKTSDMPMAQLIPAQTVMDMEAQ